MTKIKLLIVLISLFTLNGYTQVEKIFDKINKTDNDSIKSDLCNELCVYYVNSDIDSSEYYCNLSLKYSKKANSKTGIARAYNNLAIIYREKADYNKAFEFNFKALKIREKINDIEGVSNSYAGLGECYLLLGKNDSALYYHGKRVEFLKNAKNKVLLADAYRSLGIVYRNIEDYKNAIKNLLNAAKVSEEINDSTQMAYAYNSIGIVYRRMTEYEKALEYLFKSLKIKEKTNNLRGVAKSYQNIGNVYMKMEENEKAMKYYKLDYGICVDLKDSLGIAHELVNLGVIYSNINKIEKAIQNYKQALEIFDNIGNEKDKIVLYINLADDLNDINKLDESIKYAKLALDLSKKYSSLYQKKEAYLLLYSGFGKKGEYLKSLNCYKKYVTLNDSINELRRNLEVEELLTKYETEKKEQTIKQQEIEIAKEKAENEKNELIIKNTRIVIIAISLGVLLLLIVLFFVIRSYRQKQKNIELKSTIKGQEEERNKIAKELHDNIGSRLAGTSNILKNISKEYPNIEILKKLEKEMSNSYQDIRFASHRLSNYSEFDKNLYEGINEFISSVKHIVNIESDIDKKVIPETLKNDIKESIYRIIQELIINTIKHANATKIDLIINSEEQKILIKVSDNGIGFDYKKVNKGLGLTSIKQRLKYHKGNININSSNQKGTSVSIELPII